MTKAARARRDNLVLAHLPLLRSIAHKIHSSLPSCFDLEDLEQAGVLGLIEAATHYDPKGFPGVPFRGYARKRIKGAIQDSIGLHASNETRRTTRENLWAELTRPPIAECREGNDNLTNGRNDLQETPDHRARADGLTERAEQEKLLHELVDTLPRRLALVIELHYRADLNLNAIAGTHGLDVGKARISQLHADAIDKLRQSARLRGLKRAA